MIAKTIEPYYQSESVTLYHGDCLRILPFLDCIDAMITDPPYGVGFSGKRRRAAAKGKITNGGYSDKENEVSRTIHLAIEWAKDNCTSSAVFASNRIAGSLPSPHAIGGIFSPSSGTMDRWGFVTHHMIYYYGRDPYRIGRIGGSTPNSKQLKCRPAPKNGHPCPKPIEWMEWLVGRASKESWVIVDPFAGSGTTAVAAKTLGRKCILIEKDERFCEIAANRLR